MGRANFLALPGQQPSAWRDVKGFHRLQIHFIHCLIVICQLKMLQHTC